MKMTKVRLAAAAFVAALVGYSGMALASIQLGGSIFPLTYINQSPANLTDLFNQMESLINQQVAAQPGLPGAIVGFTSTSQSGNPVMQLSFNDVATSSLVAGVGLNSAGVTLIPAVAGRQVYVDGAGVEMMVSGTAAGATSVGLYCTGTGAPAYGNKIASFPVAALVDQVAANPFMVASAITYGSAISRGCPIGQGVVASIIGSSLTTTTDTYVTLPYVIQ